MRIPSLRRLALILLLLALAAAPAFAKPHTRTEAPPLPPARLVERLAITAAEPRDVAPPAPLAAAKAPEIDAALAARLAVARAAWELGRGDLVAGSVVPLVGPDGEVVAYDVDLRFDGEGFSSPAAVCRAWAAREPQPDGQTTFFSVTVAASFDVRPVRASRAAPSNFHAAGPRLASVAADLLGAAEPQLMSIYPQSSWARAYEFAGGGRAIVIEGQEPYRWWEAGAYREASREHARRKQDEASRALAAKGLPAGAALDAALAAARSKHRAEADRLLAGELAAKAVHYVSDYGYAFEPFYWWGGCSPTAGGMVLNYWDRRDEGDLGVGLLNRWYARSVSPYTGTDNCRVPEIIPRLRTLMGTDDEGWTSIYDVRPGMASHVVQRGYCDGGGPDWFGEFLDWHWDDMVNQIDTDRPFTFSCDFYPGTGGAGHRVAVFGYESAAENLLCHNTWWDCNVVEAADPSGGLTDWSSIDGVTPSCYQSQANIVLMSPRGLTSWDYEAPCGTYGAYEIGCGIPIQWAESLNGTNTYVKIYYSLDAGVNWTFVAETDDDGSYTWTPPGAPWSQVRIRLDRVVYEGGQPRVIASDASRGDFQLLPSVPHPCLVSESALNFSVTDFGAFDMKYFQVTNNTCDAIESPVIINGSSEFTVWETYPLSLQVGEYQYFHVYYQPVDCGPDVATLLFPGAPCASVQLVGQGPSQPVCEQTRTRLDLPFDRVGQPVSRSFTIRNTRCGVLGGSLTGDDPDFTVVPVNFNLGPDDSLRVTVTYNPSDCEPDTCHLDTGPLCADVLCIAQAQLTPGGWSAVTTGPLGNTGDRMSVAAGDYDADGDDDLYLACYNQPNVLLRNDGGLVFTDVTTPILADAGPTYGAGWGDIDNDGDLDLYITNFGGTDALLRNNGAAGFAPVTVDWQGLTGQSTAVSWADIEGDGDLDLYVAGYGTANMPLRNDGAAGFRRITSLPLADTGYGMEASWCDWDGDGDPDLYLGNFNQPDKLLRNNGGWSFAEFSNTYGFDGGAGVGAAWGDADGDGDFDLFIPKYTQASRLYRQEAGHVMRPDTVAPLSDVLAATSVTWTDGDLDGDLDLYQYVYGAANRLLRYDGGTTWTNVATTPLNNAGDGYAQGWGDYDRDGRPDVYLAPRNAPAVLCLNQAADLVCRSWLQVDLRGTVSNRFGVGARITVVAGGRRQVREVGAGEGGFSQNSLTAAFGLGTAVVVDSLIVRWPWRATQVHTGLPVDCQVTVVEGGGVTEVHEPELPDWPRVEDVALLPAAPNPFNPQTRIPYDLPRTSPVRLTVHDAAGRLVRTLLDGVIVTAGRHAVAWDGRDQAGRSAGSGIYLCRLEAAGEVRQSKLVLLR